MLSENSQAVTIHPFQPARSDRAAAFSMCPAPETAALDCAAARAVSWTSRFLRTPYYESTVIGLPRSLAPSGATIGVLVWRTVRGHSAITVLVRVTETAPCGHTARRTPTRSTAGGSPLSLQPSYTTTLRKLLGNIGQHYAPDGRSFAIATVRQLVENHPPP